MISAFYSPSYDFVIYHSLGLEWTQIESTVTVTNQPRKTTNELKVKPTRIK